MTDVVRAAILTAALIAATGGVEAAPIDDVRAAVGAPLGDAPSSEVAAAVRNAIIALPPKDLEQAIDLVGAVTEEVGERRAAAEIAGAAQSAVDDVARRHPDEIETWWASIIKESVLTVVEEKLAVAEQAGSTAGDADALAGAEDLPLVTVRELPASADRQPAPVERPPVPPEPKPTASAEPEPEPAPGPEPESEPEAEREAAPSERLITVQPVRDADREPVQLGAPPRTLDQQLAERRGTTRAPSVSLEEQIATAADLLRRQGRPITTETLNRAMIELGGDCSPLDLEALRAAARYGRCRDELAQRLAGGAPAAGTPGQTATAPSLDDREAFRDMVRGYATGTRR